MCTAVSWNGYFGRTLDLEHHYDEKVTVMPRNFPLRFRRLGRLDCHHAIIGVAHVEDGYPLYYDGVNERGLAMAGLNFPVSARYQKAAEGKDNVAPFELIPWVLGQCGTVDEAKKLLERANLMEISFSEKLPLTPLHWIVADGRGAIAAEPMEDGLHVYEDPVGVLANEPPFPWHMTHLAGFLNLTAERSGNRFAPGLALEPYSRGMGAMGLPGDWSSSSRFVRAAFLKENALSGRSERENVSQFFHIMGGVSQIKGCTRLGGGETVATVYTSCYDCARGVCCYTTYENRQSTGVDMHREHLDGSVLACYPLLREEVVHLEN